MNTGYSEAQEQTYSTTHCIGDASVMGRSLADIAPVSCDSGSRDSSPDIVFSTSEFGIEESVIQGSRWVTNRELYRIVRSCNYRGQQQLPDPAVATRGCCLRLIKIHEGVLARLIQVFTAVLNELIKRL